MRVKWTRDEVILGLDVLFSEQGKTLSMDSPAIIELSEFLNKFPLVPYGKRPDTFRNVSGVRRQIVTFDWSIKNSVDAPHVGDIFYEVYNEFKDSKDKLHNIAQAIRKCVNLVENIYFADKSEMDGFCEGALLGHLHRYLERQYGNLKEFDEIRCYICFIKPQHIYNISSNIAFLQPHLLIPPENYEPDLKPNKKDFILVCPNCHTMLHQIRPWISVENVKTILKTT
jgi:5-methylcytosine-specific restriction protein A